MRRLVLTVSLLASMAVATGTAQAVVVDMNQAFAGDTSVAYGTAQADLGSSVFGLALLPSSRVSPNTTAGYLASAGVPYVSSSGSCSDPAAGLEPDLLPAGSWPLNEPLSPLCWHGGGVMHANETIALEWDGQAPNTYWSATKKYVETFLSNVAAASGSGSNPFADTTQYWDGPISKDRAGNTSVFGGGCVDNGATTCTFSTSSGQGTALPAGSDCPVSGTNPYTESPGQGGAFSSAPNNICLTDADIRQEVVRLVDNEALISHTAAGYDLMVDVLTPPGVEVCLDAAGKVCSANGNASDVAAEFCSYHSQVLDGASNTNVSYVVQPWNPSSDCVEPDAPQIPPTPTFEELGTDVGAQLVSSLAQSETAAIVDPSFTGWFGQDGLEVNDEDACQPMGSGLDSTTLSGTSYFLQREFNNAAVIDSDPATYFGCVPDVNLAPSFVAPSAIELGDRLDLNGSATESTLEVPNGNYQWNFGDGSTATGPSVEHTYGAAGTYTVTLTTIDRGGNAVTATQQVQVLTANGLPAPPPSPATTPSTPTGGATAGGFVVKLRLLPQGLQGAARKGIALQVSSNEAADGLAQIMISRRAARRAHIKAGRHTLVIVGVGTVSGIKSGTILLRLHLNAGMATKLARLHHVNLTVRLLLVGADGKQLAVDVAGHY